ncbi:MAG: hypothetical protein ACI9B7_001003 [Oleispira sp.]|jgi:hypothetical protein
MHLYPKNPFTPIYPRHSFNRSFHLAALSHSLNVTQNAEAHEVSNGMIPLWMNIYEAIAHNEAVIANSDKKGLSIERETFMLKVIASELIERDLIERDLIERDLVADKQVAVKTQSIGG